MKVTFETEDYALRCPEWGHTHHVELKVKLDDRVVMESNDINTLDADGVVDHLRLLALCLNCEVEDK